MNAKSGIRCRAVLAFALIACDPLGSTRSSPPLSRGEDHAPTLDRLKPAAPPTIGALTRRVPIRSRPSPRAPMVGLLTAGATIGRTEQPVTRQDCSEGWYEVLPRGFLCLDKQATLDPLHPTLQARGLIANHQAELPYPYATTKRSLTLFEPDPEHRDGVRELGRMRQGSTFAIVGSWETLDEYDQRQRLAMLTLGAFVPTRDIEPIRLDSAVGIALDGPKPRLPIGFPIASKAPTYRFSGPRPLPHGFLDAHSPVELTAKTRTYEGERYLLLADDNYVAERDVVVARQRHEFPAFAGKSTHWVDVDVTLGLLVVYAGEQPNYVMRAQSRLAESLQRGTAWVKMKQVTDLSSTRAPSDKQASELDNPWVIELDSGVTLRAGFGANTTTTPDQTIELHPKDAARLFRFLEPSLPEGWHAVAAADPKHEGASAVVLR